MVEGSLGRGRHLADPQFPDDDGSADPRLRQILTIMNQGGLPPTSAARALRDARLLACVVAVLDAVDEAGGDKDSHMAVVSMVNDRGERGLLAFTGTDSLVAWNAEARPVPTLGRDLARAAREDGARALVIDVAGPVRAVIDGTALDVLLDELDLPAVEALVRQALVPLSQHAEVEVIDARSLDAGVDVVIRMHALDHDADGARIEMLARSAATMLSERADIQRLVPGGIGVSND